MSSTRKAPEHAAYGLLPTEVADTEAAADEAAADEAAEAAEAAATEVAEAVEEVAEAVEEVAEAAAVVVFGLDLSESVKHTSGCDIAARPRCGKRPPHIALAVV
jgi:hypothetical protein